MSSGRRARWAVILLQTSHQTCIRRSRLSFSRVALKEVSLSHLHERKLVPCSHVVRNWSLKIPRKGSTLIHDIQDKSTRIPRFMSTKTCKRWCAPGRPSRYLRWAPDGMKTTAESSGDMKNTSSDTVHMVSGRHVPNSGTRIYHTSFTLPFQET